ncbi:MAG: excinuclease ATPase subunit [Firmicutes bacterium]|nr:excinuclease ATPase subunit [Bacillota bacterium]
MTWGVSLMYYNCPKCGMKFKYALDLMQEFGESFGQCPECGSQGIYEYDGPRRKDDADYFEVE